MSSAERSKTLERFSTLSLGPRACRSEFRTQWAGTTQRNARAKCSGRASVVRFGSQQMTVRARGRAADMRMGIAPGTESTQRPPARAHSRVCSRRAFDPWRAAADVRSPRCLAREARRKPVRFVRCPPPSWRPARAFSGVDLAHALGVTLRCRSSLPRTRHPWRRPLTSPPPSLPQCKRASG